MQFSENRNTCENRGVTVIVSYCNQKIESNYISTNELEMFKWNSNVSLDPLRN